MYNISRQRLAELIELLEQEAVKNIYAEPISVLSNGSIGQHVRHIIELYTGLLNGYESGIVCYDKRKRDIILETDPSAAIQQIQFIISHFERDDKPLQLESGFDNSVSIIQSSYLRELLYNLEHCIHHQALIRAALIALGQAPVKETFGVAPSTIQYRQQCAQ